MTPALTPASTPASTPALTPALTPEKYQLIHFCVLYGDSAHLLKLFESYAQQDFDFNQWRVALVVINNNEVTADAGEHAGVGAGGAGKGAGPLASAAALPPAFEFPAGVDYSVINTGKNLGYFGAAQLALQKFASQSSLWTAISNSDLEFASPDFFSELKEFKAGSDLGALAPQIMSELSWQDQNPYMVKRPSGKKMKFLKYIFSTDLSSLIYQSLSARKKSFRRGTKRSAPRGQKIYAPHGSFILFHQNYFVRGLDFTHQPFLFGEEITIAENLRAARLTAYYEPALKIRHQEHQATGNIPNRRMRGYIKAASHYIADHYF